VAGVRCSRAVRERRARPVGPFAQATLNCALSQPHASQPGYAYFGRTAVDFQRLFFADTDPGVVDAAYAIRPPDPCGEEGSFAQALLANLTGVARIRIPVLLMYGGADALFPQPAQAAQAALYLGTPSLTTASIDGAGHYLPLERGHASAAASLAHWLTQQRFSPHRRGSLGVVGDSRPVDHHAGFGA
jgi:pimeloyl-ACP methyl ester carboxylesterase